MMKPNPKKPSAGSGYKITPGAIVQKGKPTTVTQSFKHGPSKSTYTPSTAETGHKSYGKAGGGTDKAMNKALDDARKNKQEVTKPTSKGLTYKAGTVSTVKKPDQFSTKINVTPEIRKWKISYDNPKTESKGGKSGGKLKARAVTLGGSDKKGNPANKYGVGKKSGVSVRKVKSFKK